MIDANRLNEPDHIEHAMSIGVWKPATDQAMDEASIRSLLEALPSEPLETVERLAANDFLTYRFMVIADHGSWSVAEQLSKEQIEQLIRFFTLAEQFWSGWEAGKRSAVIPLVGLLKAEGSFDPELRRWIKKNTDNRYLPNGAAL